MPIREFKCQECGEVFEELILRKDEEIRCPKCGGKELTSLLSVFAFQGKEGTTSSCATCHSTSCAKCK